MPDESTVQEVQKKRPGLRNLGRSMQFLGGYKRTAIIAVVSLFLSIGAELMVPQMIQNMLDAVTIGLTANQISALPAAEQAEALARASLSVVDLGGATAASIRALYWTVGLILLFAVMRGTFAFSQAFMAEQLSQNVAYDLRNALYAKIQRLSFSYHDRNRTGQLMIRATDDVEKLRVFIGQGLLVALQAIVMLIGTLTLLVWTNWSLTLVVLPVLPIALILFMIFGAVSQPLFRTVQAKLSALNTILQENLAGIRLVKAFARERREQARFQQAADELMQQQITIARVFSFLFPVIFLIANLGQALVLYYGGRQILANSLTVGEWQKFSLYLLYVFFPIGQLGFIISQMSQASASADRIYEILDTQNDVRDRSDATPLPIVAGRVEFRTVSFRYFDSSEPVLSEISFVAEPGQTVALLGATGSGKTTIINLIPRFYDVSAGAVLVDGHDVRNVTLESLRRQIGIVLQETNLFTGSIRENIAFGRPDADESEIVEAARAAAAHDFIESFAAGYDTAVGERGTTLSGGQKQRIAIARALLLDPHLLILDDSTSSVDVATEAKIQQALDTLMQGRTSFVIAQRISTVLNADLILVLDKGKIVASGRHLELMESSEAYAEIYRSQLVEDAAVKVRAPAVAGNGAGRATMDANRSEDKSADRHVADIVTPIERGGER